jgi:UDP:flavonoid glycosyltransferase YjiC (YdhE family)
MTADNDSASVEPVVLATADTDTNKTVEKTQTTAEEDTTSVPPAVVPTTEENGITPDSDKSADVGEPVINGLEVNGSTVADGSNGADTSEVAVDGTVVESSEAADNIEVIIEDEVGDATIEIPMANPNEKPLLVMTAPPVMGHTTPLLRLSSDMIARGFEVIFMSTVSFKDSIEKTGAVFHESVTPFADINYLRSRSSLPPGLPTLMADMENMFIKQMAPRSAEFKELLELIRKRDPSRQVVVVTETMSLAPLPFMYGAPLPKGYDTFPKTININTVPIMLLSIDTGITGPCLPPDASESGRARNKIMNEMLVRGPFSGTDRVFHEALKGLGCTSLPKVFFQNAWLESYDTTFQLCVPALEYPRSDLHRSIRFSGSLPKRAHDPHFQYPSWWPEIKANAALPAAERKKVVAVAQGTVALDYTDLIIPTLKALSKRPDVLIVTILGVKKATLAVTEDFKVPENARVIDHLPYDAILEYADIFITNGGYGGMSHGVLNGVPMILSGMSEDKAEVCARGAYAGFAINLRAQKPSPEQIYAASEKIFTEPSYKQRALRLMDENEDLDCVSIFERQIMKHAAAK